MIKANAMAMLLCTLCKLSAAEIYKSVDYYGNVTYSDTPSEDAEKMKLEALNLQPPVTPKPRPVPQPSPNKVTTTPVKHQQSNTSVAPQKEASKIALPTPTKEDIKPSSKYGLRIALPKDGSSIAKSSTPLTVVLLTKRFLSNGERFQATVNGKATGKAKNANNLQLQLPSNVGTSFSLGANIISANGDLIEQAPPIWLSIKNKKAPK